MKHEQALGTLRRFWAGGSAGAGSDPGGAQKVLVRGTV